MGYPKDALELMREIRAAERARNARISCLDELIDIYAPRAQEDETEEDYNPENVPFEYATVVGPQLLFSNPRARVSTRLRGRPEMVAKLLRETTNRWVKDTDLERVLRPTVTDYLFAYGAVYISRRPRVASLLKAGRMVWWPEVRRLSPRHYFRDPIAETREEIRFEGHDWLISYDDLLEQAEMDPEGWDLEVIRSLPATVSERDETDRRRFAGDEDVVRSEVRLYTVWWKDENPLDDYMSGDVDDDEARSPRLLNGMIYTVAAPASGEGSATFVRPPEEFFGPAWGPYSSCDAAYVIDEPYGQSAVMATRGQIQDLNRHAKVASARGARQKRVYLIDSPDEELSAKVQDAVDDELITIRGGDNFDKNSIAPIELGGMDEHNVAYMEMRKANIDRVLGLSDAKRGIVRGDGTATEQAIADKASDIRLDDVKGEYHRFVKRILETVGWYIFSDDEFEMWLSASDRPQYGEPGGTNVRYQGGATEEDGYFEDYEFEIEPMSMERSSQGIQQRRAMEAFELVVQMAQLQQAMPQLPWNDLAAMLGDAMNMPNLGDLLPKAGDGQGQAVGGAPAGGPMAAQIPMLKLGLGNGRGGGYGGRREAVTAPGMARSNVELPGRAAGRMMAERP
jgi:hypothetical protein